MLASIVVATLMVAAEPPKADEKKPSLSDAAQKELKTLEGKWQVVTQADAAGAFDITAQQLYGVFQGTTVTFATKDKGKAEPFTITDLDPGTIPKCIELTAHLNTPGRQPRSLSGIYKFDGDVLTIAYAGPKAGATAVRPATFDQPTEDRTIVWTLKRVKE